MQLVIVFGLRLFTRSWTVLLRVRLSVSSGRPPSLLSCLLVVRYVPLDSFPFVLVLHAVCLLLLVLLHKSPFPSLDSASPDLRSTAAFPLYSVPLAALCACRTRWSSRTVSGRPE